MLKANEIVDLEVTKDEKTCEIELITIDSFAKEKDLKKVDFLYLDTEGSEDHVLRGAIKTLKNV